MRVCEQEEVEEEEEEEEEEEKRERERDVRILTLLALSILLLGSYVRDEHVYLSMFNGFTERFHEPTRHGE